LIFKITEKFPRTEQFGIVSQVRRSSSSVAANIAEGFGRGTTREFLRSLQIARSELEETRYFMLLSCDLGKISREENARIDALCDSTGKLINALGRSLRSRLSSKDQSPVTSHQSRPS
jgi:four helix bundle protein